MRLNAAVIWRIVVRMTTTRVETGDKSGHLSEESEARVVVDVIGLPIDPMRGGKNCRWKTATADAEKSRNAGKPIRDSVVWPVQKVSAMLLDRVAQKLLAPRPPPAQLTSKAIANVLSRMSCDRHPTSARLLRAWAR